MLQQDEADDYVIATGETHTVRECVEIAFDEAGLGDWERLRRDRPGVPAPGRGRPARSATARKAERELGWEPKTSFEELIRLMTRADLELLAWPATARSREWPARRPGHHPQTLTAASLRQARDIGDLGKIAAPAELSYR